MPPPASIQNHFSLVERSFEAGLAEACAPTNANVGLLPWSILAGGVLSGKYCAKDMEDPTLKDARFAKFPQVSFIVGTGSRPWRPHCILLWRETPFTAFARTVSNEISVLFCPVFCLRISV